jgi:hypothetical protein
VGSFDTACVITRDEVPGAPRPGVVIADRRREIHLVQDARPVEELPSVVELVEVASRRRAQVSGV